MDIASEQDRHPTRLLFLGEETLADGFRLIGFETYPNPTPEEADRLLRDLRRDQAKALVIVDDALMEQQIPNLHRVRQEGGRIVVIAVPALGAQPRLTSEVAQRLASLFGTATLETAPSGERESS